MQGDCEEGVNACVGNGRSARGVGHCCFLVPRGTWGGTLMMITTTQVTGAWEGEGVNCQRGRYFAAQAADW